MIFVVKHKKSYLFEIHNITFMKKPDDFQVNFTFFLMITLNNFMGGNDTLVTVEMIS